MNISPQKNLQRTKVEENHNFSRFWAWRVVMKDEHNFGSAGGGPCF